MQDLTESALRAAGRGDGRAFFEALTALQPGAGHAGRLVLSIYLCKAALLLRIVKNPDLGVPPALRKTSRTAHPISLNWGPAFADRFSRDESETVWQRFAGLDAALRGDEEQFVPGYQSGPMPYHFETMPVAFGVDDLVAGWSS
jgi:hypothetical protein